MEAILIEWSSLAVRWIHIITGIAWIGASFYFNWLLNHLQPSNDPKIMGQLWALHAGGFFNVEKRNIDPGQLPEPLHWFKWESYWTWISGFTLLVIVYYFGAEAYLIDPSVADLTPWQAIVISLLTLVLGWLFYHNFWNSHFARNNQNASLWITALFIVLAAWALTQLFSGRGAFLHVGAMLATWMTGNVFFVIMPAQRQLVQATLAGQEHDKSLSQDAGFRSLHNNYLTLPVLFCMISNHYPASFSGEWNWLVLMALFAISVLVRYYFNVRHIKGTWDMVWLLIVSFVLFIGTAVLASWPQWQLASSSSDTATEYAIIQPIMAQHCVSCHAEKPTSDLFSIAPKNVMLETEQQTKQHAQAIALQVSSKAMPLGNLTNMTDEERKLIIQWANGLK